MSGVRASTSTIGRRRRAAAIASPSRVWAFSRIRSRSSSAWNAARSTIAGLAASRISGTLGSIGWFVMAKSFLVNALLRAPGGPVDLDRHTARGGPRFDQFERCVPAGVGEQPRALADHHGTDEQVRRQVGWARARDGATSWSPGTSLGAPADGRKGFPSALRGLDALRSVPTDWSAASGPFLAQNRVTSGWSVR